VEEELREFAAVCTPSASKDFRDLGIERDVACLHQRLYALLVAFCICGSRGSEIGGRIRRGSGESGRQ
jgi:hypothetical protein